MEGNNAWHSIEYDIERGAVLAMVTVTRQPTEAELLNFVHTIHDEMVEKWADEDASYKNTQLTFEIQFIGLEEKFQKLLKTPKYVIPAVDDIRDEHFSDHAER